MVSVVAYGGWGAVRGPGFGANIPPGRKITYKQNIGNYSRSVSFDHQGIAGASESWKHGDRTVTRSWNRDEDRRASGHSKQGYHKPPWARRRDKGFMSGFMAGLHHNKMKGYERDLGFGPTPMDRYGDPDGYIGYGAYYPGGSVGHGRIGDRDGYLGYGAYYPGGGHGYDNPYGADWAGSIPYSRILGDPYTNYGHPGYGYRGAYPGGGYPNPYVDYNKKVGVNINRPGYNYNYNESIGRRGGFVGGVMDAAVVASAIPTIANGVRDLSETLGFNRPMAMGPYRYY